MGVGRGNPRGKRSRAFSIDFHRGASSSKLSRNSIEVTAKNELEVFLCEGKTLLAEVGKSKRKRKEERLNGLFLIVFFRRTCIFFHEIKSCILFLLTIIYRPYRPVYV